MVSCICQICVSNSIICTKSQNMLTVFYLKLSLIWSKYMLCVLFWGHYIYIWVLLFIVFLINIHVTSTYNQNFHTPDVLTDHMMCFVTGSSYECVTHWEHLKINTGYNTLLICIFQILCIYFNIFNYKKINKKW